MDKALQREQTRKRVERYRDKVKSVTSEGVTPGSVTLLHRPNGADYNPDELLDGRKRYLGPFSDGQVLDRMTVPEPDYCPDMAACNRADESDLRRKGGRPEYSVKLT